MTFKKLETILSYNSFLADIVVIYAKILTLRLFPLRKRIVNVLIILVKIEYHIHPKHNCSIRGLLI